MPDLNRLQAMTARFAPVEIVADLSVLPTSERQALVPLIQAAQILDAVYLRQVWAGNEAMLLRLIADDSALGRARLRYFLINKGPWSRLDEDAAFVPGAPPKPAGANYYPPDATWDEIERWLDGLPADARPAANGFFTLIRRAPTGRLQAVPYGLAYQGELAEVARLLRSAAVLTREPTLKRFLGERAAALVSNDYYESDLAWMELDAHIEPTIGPYEVYEDGWRSAKAAFEAFITIRDEEETRKLARFGAHLQELEDHLPIAPRYRNPALGGLAPIRVVNEIFATGDANHGVQTAAFNLPNDERVILEKGSKRVMLKNVQQAKFDVVLVPIAGVALASAARSEVSFEAFFTHILMHELMHGLGPHRVSRDGRTDTVRAALKETYTTIEEAKADASGLWALQYLIDHGALDRSLERTVYTTFLASSFRSIRFGINEAHGRGVAIQLNFLLDAGAVVVAADGTFAIDHATIKDAVRGLTRDLLTIEAEGDDVRARDLLARLGVVRPEVQRVLDRLTAVPVDIEPIFTTASMLLRESETQP